MHERLLIAKRHARLVEDLDAILNDEAENALREADGVVIRVTKNVWDAIGPYIGTSAHVPTWVSGIRRRLPDKTVFLLREGADLSKDILQPESAFLPRKAASVSEDTSRFAIYRLTREADAVEGLFELAKEDQRKLVAKEDLLDLITTNLGRVRISGGGGFHFRLPSGNHSNYFVRLAEAFRTPDLLARAAFWVAHALSTWRNADGSIDSPDMLIVDNPSMLAVATMAVSIAARPDVEVICVEEYPQTPLEKIQLAQKLAVAVARAKSVLFFVGISSSGRLLATTKELLGGIDSKLPKKVRDVTLYSFGDAQPSALCKLEFPDFFIARSADECPACRDGSSVPAAIDPSVYYVAAPVQVEIPLIPALFQAQRKFILDYGNAEGVLRVHVEDPTDRSPRHHAFYINVGSLLQTQKVWPEINSVLGALVPKPTAILAPDHDAATRLAIQASRYLAVPLFQHKTFRTIDEFPLALKPLLEGPKERKRTLLIIDDVIRTGSRMSSINKAFREDHVWDDLLGRISHIHFLGVVSTAESKRKWQEIERGLCRNHPWSAELRAVFDIPLPNWGALDCPWCNERELLRRLIGPEVFERTAISERMSRLENTSGGLTGLPFLNIPGQSDPARAAGSAMFPENLSAMQTLFLFASAVNQSRHLPNGVNDAAFPGPRLVASRVFTENYNERMKWKALFRALKPTEVHDVAKTELAKLLGEDIVNKLEPHYFAEAFLASLRGLLRDVELQDLLRIADQLGMRAQYVSDVFVGRAKPRV